MGLLTTTVAPTASRLWFNPTHLSGLVLWLSDNSNFVALAQPSVSNPTSLDNAAWTKTRSSIDADSTADPDGTTLADTLIEDATAANTHVVTQTFGSFVASRPARVTVGLKAKERSWLRVQLGGGSAYVNASTGAVGTLSGATVSVRAVPNGFYDFDIDVANPSSGAFTLGLASADGVDSYNGDGASGVYVHNVRCTQNRGRRVDDRSPAATQASPYVENASDAGQPVWYPVRQNGRPGLAFDGVDDRLDATTVANWKFLHDGTGCTVIMVVKPTLGASVGALMTTGARSVIIPGWLIDYHGGNQRLELYIANGTSAVVSAVATAGTTLRGVPHVISYRYLEGGGTDYDVRSDGASVLSGSTTGAPSSGNPTAPLRLMSRDNAAFFSPGDVYEIAAYNRYLDDATLSSITQRLGAKWGIAVTP